MIRIAVKSRENHIFLLASKRDHEPRDAAAGERVLRNRNKNRRNDYAILS